MRALAEKLKAELTLACERIEIAGSIRRRQAGPGDIEIVCIPRIRQLTQAGLFGVDAGLGEVNELEALVERLTSEEGEWEFDPIVKRNGERYKRLRHRKIRNYLDEMAPVDLFITDARSWGWIFTLRTGPSDFSKTLVSQALQRGWFVADGGLLHQHRRQYNKAGKALPCPKGEHCSLIKPTPEEADFLAALGVPCWPPAERQVVRLVKYLTEQRRAK
jgi:DNA polymerase/3'-5' exonuclease PolX